MDKKIIGLFLISLLFLFSSYTYAFFYPTITNFATLPLTVMVIAVFLSGTIFFGFLSFIPHIFIGLALGTEQNAAIIIYIIPIIIATYAGIKLGITTLNDFNNKEYLTKQAKKILFLLIIAIIIAVVIEQLMPILIELWPKNTGLDMKSGKNVFEMIESLKQLI